MKLAKIFAVASMVMVMAACGNRPETGDVHLERDFNVVDTTGFIKVFDDIYGHPCDELHSMVVIRDGKIIYEKYALGHDADELHILWSASKTFTATAVGFAVQDSLLTVDDKVVSFFGPEDLPQEQSDWLKQMRVKDLLMMSSGFDHDPIYGLYDKGDTLNWAKETLSCPVVWEPGTRFAYNSMNTYLLSVIVSKVTGKKVVDYINEKLFQPLGIMRYAWVESPQGFSTGGWGLHLTSESLAKMGQFFLNRGSWNGQQLLNSEWFDEATSPEIYQYAGATPEEIEKIDKTDEWQCGYGYQMWMGTHGSFRLDGAHGQYVLIIPEKNAAVVLTSHLSDTSRAIRSVWEHVYPAL